MSGSRSVVFESTSQLALIDYQAFELATSLTGITIPASDLPLSYGFGYYSFMDEKVILKIKSEGNVGDFYIPTGNEDQNDELFYFVDIFDRLGLNTTFQGKMYVKPLDSLPPNRKLSSVPDIYMFILLTYINIKTNY